MELLEKGTRDGGSNNKEVGLHNSHDRERGKGRGIGT